VHLARVIFGWPAQVAGMAIPVWTSGVAFVIASGFAYWASRSTKGAA